MFVKLLEGKVVAESVLNGWRYGKEGQQEVLQHGSRDSHIS